MPDPMDAAWAVIKTSTEDLRRQQQGEFKQSIEGPVGTNNQLAQALAAARSQPRAPPLNIQRLPPIPEAPADPRQTQLPESMTSGASVGKPLDQWWS